jgi:opacity protein-like surface antigen
MSKRFCAAFAIAAISAFTFPSIDAASAGNPGGVRGVVVDWTGVYFGFHGGYAWSNLDAELKEPEIVADILEFLGSPTGGSLVPKGFLGGAHIGLQHQWGAFVLGVEAGATAANIEDKVSVEFTGEVPGIAEWGGTTSFRTEVHGLYTVGGRIGLTQGPWLGYLKGGYATAEIKASAVTDIDGCVIGFGCGNLSASTSSKVRHHGFVAGAGIEYMIHPNVIFGLEYNYIDLGARNHAGDGSVALDDTQILSGDTSLRIDPDAMHAVYARLHFKLGGRW